MLEKDFYVKGALDLAKDLLGKVLVREIDGRILKGRIIETEAYIAEIDKACHAYGRSVTKRTAPLYKEGGIAYVYFIYGLYHCFNIVSGQEGKAEAVLIRAVKPLNEIDYISIRRFGKENNQLTKYQKNNLTNGPSKLCLAYGINKEDNYKEIHVKGDLYIIDDQYRDFDIIETKRIGIDYAEEAKDFLWRFSIDV
ncbi:DNA-3-methyladenine glycosylase [Clostridium gasigenes]|uniref:DNA-3-methyladenine glycosylase n=1 Tax=Clostridium gasigenes TaxID=94869 RepID=UPI00162A7F00|nr:DNA-3-methyladenine glycosylase [Clostridium gasigenes]MBB6624713.1 DNA-3-methyladenine glycosylase [Clostridium gasigenes]MBU3087309.1 DNA-3-methyladenine glycosylase [Clostridium gasigenes]